MSGDAPPAEFEDFVCRSLCKQQATQLDQRFQLGRLDELRGAIVGEGGISLAELPVVVG